MKGAKLVRRASWNLVDQMLSAGTNAVLAFVVARAVDARGFGAFAVAFGVFSVAIGVERALVGQPWSIRHSAASPDDWRGAVAAGLGTVVAITVPAGLVVAGTGLALGGTLGPTLVAVGLLLPGLILQDACRLAFFAAARPHLAALNDALWAVLQFGAIAAIVAAGASSAWTLTAAWGGAALVCAVVGVAQLGVLPRPGRAAAWVRGTWGLAGFLLAEYFLGAGLFQGAIVALGALLGVSDVGSLRAAQVLVGPLGVLAMAMFTFGLPEMSRRATLPVRQRTRIAYLVGGAMAAVSLAYTAVMVLLPDPAGRWLLGDTWTGASGVLLPIALGSTAAGAALGPAIVIYAAGLARTTFRLHCVEAPLLVGCMFAGAWLGGTEGAAWGVFVDQALMVPLWFRQLHRSLAVASAPVADEPLPQAVP